MAAYRIKDWEHVFHFARASKAEQVTWCKFPVTRKGTAYMNLMATREGRDAYIVFIAIVRLVARAKTEGVADFPVSIIAAEACVPEKIVKRSIEVLLGDSVGWLESTREEISKRFQSDANAPLEQRAENYSSSSNLGIRKQEADTPKPAAAAAEASPPDEGERQRKIEALCKRPAWLRDGMGWIDADGAREILDMPGMHQGIWDDVVKQAKHDKNLKNPAGYIISRIRKACGVKRGGAA